MKKTLSELTAETPIGGTFNHEGETTEVKSVSKLNGSLTYFGYSCDLCIFNNKLCDSVACFGRDREDSTEAYFVKQEKQ